MIYTCESCGGTYDSPASHEETVKEAEKLFEPHGIPLGEDYATLCDSCYQRFRKWFDSLTPEQIQAIEIARQNEIKSSR